MRTVFAAIAIAALTVNAAFSTTPDTTSTYTVGGIHSYYTSGWLGIGDAVGLLRRVDVLHKIESGGTLSAEVMRNTVDTVMRTTSIDLTDAEARRRWHVRQRGHKFSVKLENEKANEPWQVKEIHLLVEPQRT